MPTHKVKGGYKWGKSGKVYSTKKQADKQGQAIYASGWRENKNINEAFSPYSLLLMGIIRKTHDELCNKGYDENVVDNYININNIQIEKKNNNFIFLYQNRPIFEMEYIDDLTQMIIQSSNKMIDWFIQNNMVKESINEIGDTPKGQYALGAVRGRALSRTLYQPKYQRPSERNKQGDKSEKAFMKGWSNRNNVKNPKELEDMVTSYRQGYDYGFKKGMKENNNKNMSKQLIRITENDLKNIIKESVNNILKEYDEARKKLDNTMMRSRYGNNNIHDYKGKAAMNALGMNGEENKECAYSDNGVGEYNRYDMDKCIRKTIKEAFTDVYQPHNFRDINEDYYSSYVIVDGTRAVLGSYDNYEEAVEDARNLAQRNKYGTYEVYGVDSDGTYALEENYPEYNTLVYSTDEDFK